MGEEAGKWTDRPMTSNQTTPARPHRQMGIARSTDCLYTIILCDASQKAIVFWSYRENLDHQVCSNGTTVI